MRGCARGERGDIHLYKPYKLRRMMSYRVCARTTTVKPSRTRITIRLKNEYDYGSRRMPSKVVILRSTAVVRNFKNELRAKTIREMLLIALIQTVFDLE